MRFLVVIALALLTACAVSTDEQLLVGKTNPALWMPSDPAAFGLQQKPQQVDMELVVRVDPTKNSAATLPLVITTTLPNLQYARDTIIVPLRDNAQKPLGKRQGSAYDITTPYRRNSLIPQAVMKIAPENPTVGIHFVTLKITPVKQ